MNSFIEYWDNLLTEGEEDYQLIIEKESLRLQNDSVAREEVKRKLEQFIAEVDFVPALAHLNVPSEVNFSSEFFGRLKNRLLPRIYKDHDFIGIIVHLDAKHKRFLREFDFCSPAVKDYLKLISPKTQESIDKIRQQFLQASELISIRIASMGSNPQIIQSLRSNNDYEECFIRLQRQISSSITSSEVDYNAILESCDLCIKAARFVRAQSKFDGISIALTYKLLSIEKSASRIKKLVRIAMKLGNEVSSEEVSSLLRQVVSDEAEITELSSLFDNSASLLMHQISEHNSEYGEKYTGGEKADFWWIWKAGAIGGLIVGSLGILKPILTSLMLPPLVEASMYGVMYSFIFLVIYFSGGVLATKQPAMTAARLASAIDGAKNSERGLLRLSELFVNIFRIQTSATLANALFAFPMAYLVASAFNSLSLADAKQLKAEYLVTSLHPVYSGTLFYAFLTGIALAISGFFGGLMINWFKFENIEERIERFYKPESFIHRCLSVVGKRVGGVSSNICLGLLLGLFSELGYLLGLPFDVRHITFASSQIGTSLGMGYELADSNTWIWLLISIALIGVINLMVSFFITIWTIFKSRSIKWSSLTTLFKFILARFLKNPLAFFLPVGLGGGTRRK